MRHKQGRNWNMARNNEKKLKINIAHCWIWNMARNLTNKEKEKLTQQDMKYGEKH